MSARVQNLTKREGYLVDLIADTLDAVDPSISNMDKAIEIFEDLLGDQDKTAKRISKFLSRGGHA